jgi:diaminopimelate epimerase
VRNGFYKGHGLGNDYLVVDPEELDFRVTPGRVRKLCDRHRGVGSDGLLVLAGSRRADFGLRIWNPDGSEAEKSGNGLRIFARYLHATRRTRRTEFSIETRGGIVRASLELDRHGEPHRARIEMGAATFRPSALPCSLALAELVDAEVKAGGQGLRFTGVSVGNPHCVVFAAGGKRWTEHDLARLGPELATHRIFPRGTNVQLARVSGAHSLDVLVWERGAGVTETSGSSASAAACAAVRRGLVESPVRVDMPGGSLGIEVGADFDVVLHGEVSEVARGSLCAAFLRELGVRAR